MYSQLSEVRSLRRRKNVIKNIEMSKTNLMLRRSKENFIHARYLRYQSLGYREWVLKILCITI